MDMPPIHMCAFLSHENERLKTKIADLKRHINHLERRIKENNHDHSRSCSISCQTDINIQPRSNPLVTKLPSEEQLRLHRLLKAQNELLKKYENETMASSSSSGRVTEYEQRLIRLEREKEQAERRAMSAQKRMEKFEERYERMKKEISVLDENFFEEIEDLKFALQQANDLNREYEKTVQMLSTRLGISYPTTIDKRN
jgi:chromosome segregation ATPase